MRSRPGGFTLIEIMVVVAIIGLLIGLVSMKVVGTQAAASRQVTLARMAKVKEALGLYKLDTKKYPTADQGLKILTAPAKNRSDSYLDEEELNDAWGNPLQYTIPGPNGRPFDLVSHGDDGSPGGLDENADFSCWETGGSAPASP